MKKIKLRGKFMEVDPNDKINVKQKIENLFHSLKKKFFHKTLKFYL